MSAMTFQRPMEPLSERECIADVSSGVGAMAIGATRWHDWEPTLTSQTPQASGFAPRHPKRNASMVALSGYFGSPAQPFQAPISEPAQSEQSYRGRRAQSQEARSHLNSDFAIAEESSQVREHGLTEHSDVAQQHSPPPPVHAILRAAFRDSLDPATEWAMLSTVDMAGKKTAQSSLSKRSSPSLARSPAATSSVSDFFRSPSPFSTATWEDDVDFCYQQEAEATCEFDWDNVAEAQETELTQTSLEIRSSAGIAQFGPPISDFPNLRQPPSTDSFSARNQAMNQHKRGSSVGHRGFLAARMSSVDMLNKPNISSFGQSRPESRIIPPTLPVPDIAQELSHSRSTPAGLNLSGIDNLQPLGNAPTKHRKSNSFDASERRIRPEKISSEATRWSSAPFSSLPDLLHSHRRSRSSIRKCQISSPMECLSQNPIPELEAPPEFYEVSADQDAFMMRRPQTSGDRALLQAAGRASQRGRSPLLIQTSRTPIRPNQEVSSLPPGPDWI